MAYRKSTYDPKYQMNAEDLRRHRRLNLTLVPFFLVISMQMLKDDPSIFIQIAWVAYLLLEFGILMGWGYKLWAREEVAILDDELGRHHQAIAYRWGFVAAIVTAVFLILAAPYVALDVREAGMCVLLAALVTACLRFALLEGLEEPEEEEFA
ncbi:hypothetical protein WJS89_09330 [Sphingomicrobium sp. XHP0235]|uniref:hypothetical protein n=1 Tax=Sphingomicrobium aquimarinum TaxID=3133971 RepID=UPI0031FEB43A